MGHQPASPFSIPVEKILSRNPALLRGTCFLWMALSHSLLSYIPLSTSLKLWILVFGILFPFALIWLGGTGKDAGKKTELFPSPSPWLWMGLAFAALFLRFYRLTTLSSWPLVDEGFYGYFATRLEEKWDWQLVHGFAQLPALYTWGLSLCFKVLGNSFFSLWLFPALCSLLAVPLAGWTARKIFGKSMGWIAACWMAFSFWPLYMGRFGTQNILMVAWECLAFGALARYWEGRNKTSTGGRLLFLAFVLGCGFYIYLGWPAVAVTIPLALLWGPAKTRGKRVKPALFVSAVSLFMAAPLYLETARDYKWYFQHLWAWGGPASGVSRFVLPLAYVKGLFWGCDPAAFSYGPLWGGLFNPLLTALVFLGLASLLKTCRKPLHAFLLGLLALFFLPAALTNNFEMMRLALLLPILIAVGAQGTGFLLSAFRFSARPALLALIFLASLALDSRHLFVLYPASRAGNPPALGAYKTPEFEEAYSILKPMAESQGPGIILLNFIPDPYDQTLFTMAYGFNAASNSRFDPSSASWAAVLTNIHEQPYLKKLFPGGRWIWLSEGMGRPDGGLILEITPVTPPNRGILTKWMAADQSLAELTRLVMEFGVDPDQNAMFAALDKAYPMVRGDRLLESRYWRIRALHHAAAGQTADALSDEEKAMARGYPMAHLENERGCLLDQESRAKEAGECFKQALRLRPNCTNAEQNLKNLASKK